VGIGLIMPSEPFHHCHEDKEEARSEPLTLPLAHDACGENAKLLSYGDIPEWYQDNQYIQAGYRPVSGSAKTCFRSWFRLHNELVNIHSHLVPALAFLLAEAYILEPLHRKYANATPGDYVVLAFFLFTATVCFGLSACYHTLICHSQNIEAIWLRLDLVGIILLILGSFVTGIYVGFWCENLERNIYWGMVGIPHELSSVELGIKPISRLSASVLYPSS
jgi:adiponectin receptor